MLTRTNRAGSSANKCEKKGKPFSAYQTDKNARVFRSNIPGTDHTVRSVLRLSCGDRRADS